MISTFSGPEALPKARLGHNTASLTMSLALRSSLFSFSSSGLARRPILAAAAATALWNPSYRFALPSWTSLLEFFPSILWAVPKKKVSHSRKAMRASNKGLKDKSSVYLVTFLMHGNVSEFWCDSVDLVSCPGCGSAKLAHHLCPNCYSEISRGYKQAAREEEESRGQ